MNEVFASSKTTINPYKGNQNNKISNTTTLYSCFICGGPNHKIFDRLHWQVA